MSSSESFSYGRAQVFPEFLKHRLLTPIIIASIITFVLIIELSMDMSLKTRRFPRNWLFSILTRNKKAILRIIFIQFFEIKLIALSNNNFQLMGSKTRQSQKKN